ncbi:MAG: hypothetical protein ABFD89_05625 [Bryobacteraceae bacterium]
MSRRVQRDQKRVRVPGMLGTANEEAVIWPAPRPPATELAEVCPFDPELLPETERARVAIGVLVGAGWARPSSVVGERRGGAGSEENLINPAIYSG